MKQISYFVCLLFVFLPLLFLTGCEKDEMKVSANDSTLTDFDYQSVDDARQWFYQQTGGNVFLERELSTKSTGVQTTEVPLFGDWENSISQRVGHINNVETPVFTVGDEEAFSEALNGTSLLKSESMEETVRSRTRIVVQTNEESGETRGFLMTVVLDEDYLASGGSIDSVDYYHRGETFSGLIVFNHLDGSFANAWKYKDGEIISGYISDGSQNENSLKSIYLLEVKFCNDIYLIYNGNVSYLKRSCFTRTLPVMSIDDGGGGGVYDDWFPDDGGGGGSSGSGTYIEKDENSEKEITPSNPDIDYHPSFETSSAQCVKDKLDKGDIINRLLAGMELDTSDVDLIFTIGQLDSVSKKTNGRCVFNPKTGDMEIIIDQERLTAPSISLARTILHECFHAYIYAKLFEPNLHQGLAPEPNFLSDWNQYKSQYGDTAQHNYMADRYIGFMKDALASFYYLSDHDRERKLFEGTVGDNDFWDVDTFFEVLSWGGLKKTDAFKDYYRDLKNQREYNFYLTDFIPKWPT